MSEQDSPGLDPFKQGKWQGKVETRLDNIESSVSNLTETVDGLPDRLERCFEKVINSKLLAAKAKKSNNPVSIESEDDANVKWKDVAKDFLLPLILSGAGAAIAIMLGKAIGAL